MYSVLKCASGRLKTVRGSPVPVRPLCPVASDFNNLPEDRRWDNDRVETLARDKVFIFRLARKFCRSRLNSRSVVVTVYTHYIIICFVDLAEWPTSAGGPPWRTAPGWPRRLGLDRDAAGRVPEKRLFFERAGKLLPPDRDWASPSKAPRGKRHTVFVIGDLCFGAARAATIRTVWRAGRAGNAGFRSHTLCILFVRLGKFGSRTDQTDSPTWNIKQTTVAGHRRRIDDKQTENVYDVGFQLVVLRETDVNK